MRQLCLRPGAFPSRLQCLPGPPRNPAPMPLPQLLAAAGMDKGALEEELAAREEALLVAEFRRNLEFNLKKVGGLIG